MPRPPENSLLILCALSETSIQRQLTQAIDRNKRYDLEFVNPDELNRFLARHESNGQEQSIIVVVDQQPDRDTLDDGVLSNGELEVANENQSAAWLHVDRHLNVETVLDRINREADRIRLLMRPPRRKLREGEAIRVHVASSEEELKACLALRFDVYNRLGYLPEREAATKNHLEMDSFDRDALHFAATENTTGKVVGTMRLLSGEYGRLIQKVQMLNTREVARRQRSWCERIAKDPNHTIFSQIVDGAYWLPLMIQQSFKFPPEWERRLSQPELCVELSRMVVDPRYRGLGVSRLMARTGIAASVATKRRWAFLECIPKHQVMYEKYGFKAIEGVDRARAVELDQEAVAMYLELSPDPINNPYYALAMRDLEMATSIPAPRRGFGHRHLCLCRKTLCWEKGEFSQRHMAGCPLRTLHVPEG